MSQNIPSSKENEAKESKINDVPTLFPQENFNKYSDAETLRKSMKGLGTDEQPIIEILCNRSNQQRQELKKVYYEFYKRDLAKDLHSELSGNFRDTIELLMQEPAQQDAYYIRKALIAQNADYKVMIEILATRNYLEINKMKESYEKTYKETIEQELQNKFDGPLLSLMNNLIKEVRSISEIISKPQITKDLKDIFSNESFNQDKFNYCVSLRSYSHLKAMFEEYQNMYGSPIDIRLQDLLSGTYMESVVYLDDLIRVIITRCEIDMDNIKRKFDHMYNASLVDFIKGDTSRYYCKALLTLIGVERTSKVWDKFGNMARLPIRLINSKTSD